MTGTKVGGNVRVLPRSAGCCCSKMGEKKHLFKNTINTKKILKTQTADSILHVDKMFIDTVNCNMSKYLTNFKHTNETYLNA